jgi:2-polyprenyl-3-methyl-5-hydroxy-6-metoxy-1,4-benzoquinol methylase
LAREGLAPATFDTVIAADILEHLVNPWDLLLRIKPYLAHGAQLIASIPNIRNVSLLSRVLLEGRWEYMRTGLLDVTHLRFFTFTEMCKMFTDTGYAVEHQAATILPALRQTYEANKETGAPELQSGRLMIRDVTPNELMELCAEGFVLRCRPS